MSDRQSNGIPVFSSRATDILIGHNGEKIRSSEGGPILFIEKAFHDAGVPFVLHENERATVEIQVRQDNEYGRILTHAHKQSIAELASSYKWGLVSTLLDEWELQGKLPKYLLVDVQGYVRDGVEFGKKRPWPFDDNITAKIFCIKGTSEELKWLPEVVLERQKKTNILVETCGRDGSVVYAKGKKYVVHVSSEVNPVDTIGAGDTFFAYFAAALYRGENPQLASEYATAKTSEFLISKV